MASLFLKIQDTRRYKSSQPAATRVLQGALCSMSSNQPIKMVIQGSHKWLVLQDKMISNNKDTKVNYHDTDATLSPNFSINSQHAETTTMADDLESWFWNDQMTQLSHQSPSKKLPYTMHVYTAWKWKILLKNGHKRMSPIWSSDCKLNPWGSMRDPCIARWWMLQSWLILFDTVNGWNCVA